MTDSQSTRRGVLKRFAVGATCSGALVAPASAHDDDDSGTDAGNDTSSETGGDDGRAGEGSGRVVLTFDHASPSVFETAAPMMEEYGFTGLLAVVTDRVGGDIDRLEELQSLGWEIGSHSLTKHPRFTNLSRDELVRQSRESKEWLVDNGFAENGGSIVYPYGAADAGVADVVREYFAVGFYGGGPTDDPLLVGRVNGDDVAATKRAVDAAAADGGTAAVMYHTVGEDNERVTTEGFRETMEHVAESDVRVVPASALADGREGDE